MKPRASDPAPSDIRDDDRFGGPPSRPPPSDVIERTRAGQGLRMLARAGEILAGSLDYERTLAAAADLAVPDLASFCIIDLCEDDGRIQRVALACPRAADATVVEAVRRAVGTGATPMVRKVLETGEPLLVPEVPHELAAQLADTVRVSSLMVVPLRGSERMLGVIMLATIESGRRYDEVDLGIAVELARRAASAIEHARLHEALARAAERMRFRIELSRRIAEPALERGAILSLVAEEVATFVGDLCVIRVISEDGALLPVAGYHHRDPEARALLAQLRDLPHRVCEGIAAHVHATGQPVRIAALSPELARSRAKPEYLPWLDRYGAHSIVIVPIRAHDRVLGTIMVTRDAPGRPYTADDEVVLAHVAERAAFALVNASLFAAEQRERRKAELAARRISRVQEVTAALSKAITPQQVAEVAMSQALAATGALRGLVIAGDDDATASALATAGSMLPGESLARPDSPLAAVYRTGAPVFVESREEYERRFPHVVGGEHSASLACLPLTDARGVAIGAIALGFDAESRFSDDEREFLLVIARQSALALERARLYEAELRARRDAEVASRAKDEFLANLSHELRTPLTAILGWANILRARRPDAVTLDRALEVIERNAAAQAQIIGDILDVGRIISGRLRLELRRVDPADAVAAAVDAVRPAAEAKDVSVEAAIAPDIGLVRADPTRIQQIAWNLLSNAVKFTPKGGRVTLRLDRHHSESAARLTVTDTGQGIEQSFLPHVFERFRQADSGRTRAHGGLGLGLAIVKHLVELHGGAVQAESEGAGKGATFTVTLPTEVETPPAGDAPGPAQPGRLDARAPLAGLCVLVVDDDPETLEVVARVLRDHGAAVREASSAAEALGAIERGAIDLLVTDIGMPHEDGYTLLQKARAIAERQRRALPALALTAYAGAEDASMARRAGFQMHLGKPIAPMRLVEAVTQLAAEGAAP